MSKKEKKSKKQKKKELEEKRCAEEELLRQQQEEERKRQEELEQQRREEEERHRLLREKRRKEELLRLEKEREEDSDLVEKRQSDLQRLIAEQSQQREWKNHLKCGPLPDITNVRELNEFVTQWTEYDVYQEVDALRNTTHKFHVNQMKYFMQDIENGYKLLHNLQTVIVGAIQQNDTEHAQNAKQKYIDMIQIGQQKIDALTLKCLNDDFFTSAAGAGLKEDGDVIQSCSQRHIQFGLWASPMANAFKDSKIDFEHPLGIKIELPKKVAMKAKMPLACRVTYSVHHAFIQWNTSTEYESVGPVLNVQLLKLPAAPCDRFGINGASSPETEDWMVQNAIDEHETLKQWEYATTDEADQKSAETVQIAYKLPAYIVVRDPEHISVGWWHEQSQQWKTSDFKDIAYDQEQRVLSFTTCHLAPLCLVQPRGTWYEYADWKLAPSGVERCTLSLQTRCKLEFVIEIIGGQCKLLQPDIPELKHINRQLLKPHQLLSVLRWSGINLCYKMDRNLSTRCLQKNAEIESFAHLEISNIAAVFQTSMSKCNRSVHTSTIKREAEEEEVESTDVIIFRVRKPLSPNEEADLLQSAEQQNTADTQDAENKDVKINDAEMWHTVMINAEKCTFIDCNEKSIELNLNTPARELSHKTLLRCLTAYCTEDDLRDLDNTSFRFKETVRRTLNLLNPLRV